MSDITSSNELLSLTARWTAGVRTPPARPNEEPDAATNKGDGCQHIKPTARERVVASPRRFD